jgi:hypothetical protein
MKYSTVILAAVIAVAMIAPARACSPAPSCWIDEGPSYLRSICKEARDNAETLKYVDEPRKIPAFKNACKKLGIITK